MKQIKFLPLTICLACATDSEKESEAPELEDYEDPADDICAGNAPVIVELGCENTGLQDNADAGQALPTMTFSVNATDEDGDLNAYNLLIEFDDVLDGSLADDAEQLTVSGSVSNSDECSVENVTISTRVFLQGGPPEYDTEFEFYFSLFDAAGERSAAEMIVCRTPDENGDGDP